MGKASKWLRNFLLGRKEDKCKKHGNVLSIDYKTNNGTGIPPQPPKVKRRWSFGRSSSPRQISHRSSRSVDSIEAAHLAIQAKMEYQILKGHITALSTMPRDVRNAAATKIQAAFRSYLARRALCALRGLVKLQALVRGYLVRKQMTAALRSMHALMSIQVRARFHRIQMSEEAQIVNKRHLPTHNKTTRERDNFELHKELMDTNLHGTFVMKSKSGYFNHPNLHRIEDGFTTYYSGELSGLMQGQQYEELYFSSHNSPRVYSISRTNSRRASFSGDRTNGVSSLGQNYSFVPHYMANTESSRAKTRSQSEPKQRPLLSTSQRSKRNPPLERSTNNFETQMQNYASKSKLVARENNEPWFAKLYRSRRSYEGEIDTASTLTSHSNYTKSLIEYEPHLSMY